MAWQLLCLYSMQLPQPDPAHRLPRGRGQFCKCQCMQINSSCTGGENTIPATHGGGHSIPVLSFAIPCPSESWERSVGVLKHADDKARSPALRPISLHSGRVTALSGQRKMGAEGQVFACRTAVSGRNRFHRTQTFRHLCRVPRQVHVVADGGWSTSSSQSRVR
jgi:hypothetical protein